MATLAERYKRRHIKVRAKSLLPTDMIASMKREENVISRFLEDKDLPSWYRGTSQFQNEAADSLLDAIRDDTEQRTTYRVRHCLHVIGLEPNISAQQAELLKRLSRGNDLAFLWFVMELYYKTKGPDYSVNEQLIMSSIAHLDMIPTLREFDRILPSSDFSKREWERRQRWAARDSERLRAEEEEEEKRAADAAEATVTAAVEAKPRRKKELAYFQKLPRPRPYGQPLSVPMPDFKVSFASYKSYKDPDYLAPNELNRWYENYQLQPEKRVVNGILNDTVGEMFEDYERCLTKANKTEMLCEHHKVIREMEETLEAELNVLARDKCLDYINPDQRKKKERVERITKALDCEINYYLYKFHAMANKSKKKMLIMNIAGDDDCKCHEIDKSEIGWLDDLDYEEEGSGKCSADTESVEYASTTQRVSVDDKRSSDTAAGMRAKRTDEGNNGGGDCLHSTLGSSTESDVVPRTSKPRVSIADSILSNFSPQQPEQQEQHGANNKCKEKLNGNGTAPSTSATSHTYFEATTEHKPYVFHYNKIFSFKKEPSENKRLQQSVIRALISNVNLHKYTKNSQMDVKKALDDCVDEQWCSGVRAKNAELKEKEEADAEAERNKPPEQRGLLHYDREYFDPEDKPLMLQMVKDAIEELKKNPRFVVASMPEAYKLPLLREWISHRYGKRYTRAELHKLFQQTVRIFKALEKISLKVPLPNTKQLGGKSFVDYSCRDYMLKKAKAIKADYYRRLNASIMEQTRIFWFAMRPYLCSRGPPRTTFFAYMPASVKHIMHFRIWKPNEFMNAKAQWDRRQSKKRRSGI